MSFAIFTSDDHPKYYAARELWRKRFLIVSIVCLAAAWFAVYQTILYQQTRSIQNTKTAIVAAQAAAMSNIATILMSETGQIIKSNSPADDMLAGGENVEGRNIHEFCVEKHDWDRAVNGMSQFYRRSAVGTVVALPVVLRLPKGETQMIVIATTIKRSAGSDIAYAANLIYQTQFTYSPAAHPTPVQGATL